MAQTSHWDALMSSTKAGKIETLPPPRIIFKSC